MEQGNGKPGQIHLRSAPDVFLAGPGIDDSRRDGRCMRGRDDPFDDVSRRRGFRQAEVKRKPPEFLSWLPVESRRRAQDAEAWLRVSDRCEQRRRRPIFVDLSGDGADFQVRVDRLPDVDQIVSLAQFIDELPEVHAWRNVRHRRLQSRKGSPRSAIVLARGSIEHVFLATFEGLAASFANAYACRTASLPEPSQPHRYSLSRYRPRIPF